MPASLTLLGVVWAYREARLHRGPRLPDPP